MKSNNFHKDKSYGQHFLIDKNVLQKIAAAGEITSKDCVLEIGAGLGILTEELIKEAGQVLSFEIDARLMAGLQEKFSQAKNLELKNEDILSWDLNSLSCPKYKMISNIPYNITSKILEKFLMATNKPQTIVLLVQKEVAERICAPAGEKSFLSVMVQYFGQPEILQIVKATAFDPPPQVESAILRISQIASRLPPQQEKNFFRLVKVGFSQKRKMLKKNLKSIFSEVLLKKSFAEINLNTEARAEEVSLANWLKLAEKLD